MLWSEVDQETKEKLFDTQWDHLGTGLHGHKIHVIWYNPDGSVTLYGPYSGYAEAKQVMKQIAEENVNHKYPFLKDPVQDLNIDGAANLISIMIKQAKTSYIAHARALKRNGLRVPTSREEYKKFHTADAALYDDIKFMEEGAFGALGLLKSGISGNEILRDWRNEALGYRRFPV